MKFPSIANVAIELRNVNKFVEGECDVRLQVYDDGSWAVRFGPSDYDQDHHGYWGCSFVPGPNKRGRPKRFRAKEVARDLLEQVKEQYYTDKELRISKEDKEYGLGYNQQVKK